MQLYQKKRFSQFLFAFSKFRFNLNISEKKRTLLAGVFLNLRLPKDVAK